MTAALRSDLPRIGDVQEINVDEALITKRSSIQGKLSCASTGIDEETAALEEANRLETAAAQYQAVDDAGNEQASLAR